MSRLGPIYGTEPAARSPNARTVYVVSCENVLSQAGRELLKLELVEGDERRSLAGLCAHVAKLRGWNGSPLAVSVDGDPVEEKDRQALEIEDFSTVSISRRPGDGPTVALLFLAIASAAVSASLATKVKAPRPTTSADGARQYGFSRFSNDAFVGEAQPVPYGRRRRWGGKVIAKITSESADGSGDARLKILIDLGCGPIAAIGSQVASFDQLTAAAVTGINLNDQPLANFPGAKVSGRTGAAGQSAIAAFKDTEILREVGVGGAELRNTSGIERTDPSTASGEAFLFTTVASVNAIVSRIRFPVGLYSVTDNGSVNTRRVQYRYRTRLTTGPGAWSAWTVITVERADQAEFFSSPRTASLNGGTAARHDIQIERVSIEPTDATSVDRMIWDSAVEITISSNTYPGRALLAVELTAGEQLTGIPRVSVDVQGLKVRVWDGVSSPSSPVFVTQYSTNPAWLALETLTNKEWGMGGVYADADVDFPSLISWAQYCDEAVARPSGGTRPRFAINLVMDEQRHALDWLRTICRAGRCVPVTVGNRWRFVVDRPQATPVEVFTDRSIAVEDGFAKFAMRREPGTGGLTRPNRLTCQFENEQGEGQPDVISYPDYGLLWLGGGSPEPVREEAIRLDGVTDPDQVAAELVYLMNRGRFLERTVRFTTTKPVVAVQPGDRFDVACSVTGWGTASGGVRSATSNTIKLDRTVTLAAATTYVVRVEHQDGQVETKTIASGAGTYAANTALTITGTWSQVPAEFSDYALGVSGVEMKPFLCTGVRFDEKLQPEISGLEYAAGVYDPNATAVTLPTYSTLNNQFTPPGPVQSLVAYERLTPRGRQVELSWRQTEADREITAAFRIYRRLVGSGVWVLVPGAVISTRGAVVEIFDTDFGYDFCVIAVSQGGAALSPYDPRVLIANVVLGLSAPPPPEPTGVSVAVLSGNLYRISWTQPASTGSQQAATAWMVMSGGPFTTPGIPATVLNGEQECFIVARPVVTHYDVELARSKAVDFWVRSIGENGRMSRAVYAHVAVSNPNLPAGEAVKLSTAFVLASDGTRTNLAWDAGQLRLELTGSNNSGVWTSQEVDTGSLTLTRLCSRMLSANDTADPTILTTPFTLPSIEADQWGVVSVGPPVVGMIDPPYPDKTHEYIVELRTNDGAVWTDWAVWPAYTSVRRTLRKYQVRVTLKRSKQPYRPALRGFDVVATH